MPLYLVTRPAGAEHLRNPHAIHGALVEAVDGPAAIVAANALAPNLNTPFAGFDITEVAATAAGGFAPALVQGDVLGDAYSGSARGA